MTSIQDIGQSLNPQSSDLQSNALPLDYEDQLIIVNSSIYNMNYLIGYDELSNRNLQQLSETIFQSGNQKSRTDMYKTALYLSMERKPALNW
jgi:hypothetical protein